MTFAVKGCTAPSVNVGADGVITTAGAVPMVSTALVVYALPEDAVAVIVQALPAAAVAVNRPPEVILPHDAAHLTAELAVNCCVCPCKVAALAGVIVIGELIVAVVDAEAPPP